MGSVAQPYVKNYLWGGGTSAYFQTCVIKLLQKLLIPVSKN